MLEGGLQGRANLIERLSRHKTRRERYRQECRRDQATLSRAFSNAEPEAPGRRQAEDQLETGTSALSLERYQAAARVGRN